MLEIELFFENGEKRLVTAKSPVEIGRAATCVVRIVNWRVGSQHARLLRSGAQVMLEDLGTLAGTVVNGKRVTRHDGLGAEDDVLIGPCRLRVRALIGQAPVGAQPQSGAEQEPLAKACAPAESVPLRGPSKAWQAHRSRLHSALQQALDLRRRDVAGMSDEMLRCEGERLLQQIMTDDQELSVCTDRALLCQEVLDEAVGLGPLEPLLGRADVSEIMVNRYDEIYIERHGRLIRQEATFSSEQSVRWVIERIVAPLGRRIDESSPMVDARLPDGSRVNAVIPPVSIKGASLTIRKFPIRRPQMPDLIRSGSLDESMAQFLSLCVRARKNMIVSGGTGSGKTTLLNILSNEIPEGERVVTIEDAAELRLHHAHLVALEARPANLEGRGRIDIRDLVRNALRMRPDRIVVGECRGMEAFDMLTAMNTGHEGSLTTLHANTPRDAMGRLESMVLMAGLDLPLAAVREQIASSIDIVVQQARLADGRRVVTSIVEITGMESGRIQMQELFRFERPSSFIGGGTLPSFANEWRLSGIVLETAMFCGHSVTTTNARDGSSTLSGAE